MLIPAHKDEMLAPPFEKPWQQWFFIGFIILFALFPFLPKPQWVDRSAMYLILSENNIGGMAYIASHALQESEDIDVLFLGGSSVGAGVNPLIVKDALRPLLGREPVVKVLTHPFNVLDIDYITLLDILNKRKVKLLIWDTENYKDNGESYKLVYYLWDAYLHRSILRQLPMDQQHTIYFSNMMNGLRLLLSPFKDHLSPIELKNCANRAMYLGHCRQMQKVPGLESTLPPSPHLSLEQLMHHRNIQDAAFEEEGGYTDYDRIFLDAVFRVADEEKISVAFIQVPNRLSHITTVPTIAPNEPGYDSVIIGASLSDLFPGKTLLEIQQKFYIDKMMIHLHYAGADYYTRAILPAIVDAYKQTLEGKPIRP